MKVLMLTPSFFPIVGGTESVVQNLALKLNENGVKTDVMTFNMNEKWNPIWKEEVRENDFRVTRVPAFNFFHKIAPTYDPLDLFFKVNVIPKLTFAKRLKDYDILHFHDDVDLSFPVFSCFIRKPKVFHCHTLASSYRLYKTAFFARELLKKAGHSYVCVSNFTKNLLTDLGVPNSKVFVSHNGVDTEEFRPAKEKKLDNLLLFVGRPEKRKGLHVLLNSLMYLEIPVRLKIVGPTSNDSYVKEALVSIKKKGMHEVECLGKVSKENLIDLYQRASVFVCPSLWEDFGLVTLEALSCGTPVVASNVGGIKEVVKHNTNGILVPPNNPKDLAVALRKLLADKGLRETLGKNGRKIIEDNFSWDSIAKRLIEIYYKTISI
jgi:glycosyltransferase involved in cell wall biosynthesis